MDDYRHTVHYYETDKMGITHHSNYIRWMEEARTDMFRRAGCGYEKLEEKGLISPVITLKCEYKATTTYPDVVKIRTSIKKCSGVRLVIGYEMRTAGREEVVFTAESQHCFLNGDGRPVNLKKAAPEFYSMLRGFLPDEK